MEERSLLALILADQRVRDVQDDAITDGRKRINLGHRFGQPRCICFEAHGVIDAADGEAEQIAANAGSVVIQKRRDVDNFGDLPGHEF